MSLDVAKLLAVLRSVTGPCNGRPTALHEPLFASREWEYVKETLDSGWVSSVGPRVSDFESRLAKACDVRHAVAVVNGHAALHLALLAVGVRPGDEVIVPSLTFAATANAVSYIGAIPHFADSEDRSFGIDAAKLARHLSAMLRRTAEGPVNAETGRPLRAVVPMHVFGHPADMDAINAVCSDFGLTVVEDAAEALGSRYKGRPAGSLSRVAALSFNGNKIVTTGGGGAVLTDSDDIAALVRHLSTTAKKPHRWEYDHDMIGFNYRMPNLNAALGCAQLERLEKFVEAKRLLADRYRKALTGFEHLDFVGEPQHAHSNYWLNAILLAPDVEGMRDAILMATNDAGLMTRPAWKPLHQLAIYESAPRMDLHVAESLARRIVNIPSGPALALQI